MSLKQAHFNLFAYGTGHHQAAWRAADSSAERLGELDYWVQLAHTAERGLFDAFFLADGQSLSPAAAQAGPTWFYEPLTLLSALSQHTEYLGLVCTVSSSFFEPYAAARLLASLDHLCAGRAGVNVVTSMWDAEAQNYSRERLGEHAERYARAEEFLTVLRELWGSFPRTALETDRAGRFVDPSQLRELN
ncbi:MAG: LLM class flavin-dependent oxidoreductase, partial [Glutamicibacter arilaitensis]